IDDASDCRVTGNYHDWFIAACEIASNCHAEGGRKRGSGVPRAVAIVVALRAQKKTVQSTKLAHGRKTIESAGEHFVDVTLMAHVHHETVARCVEHAMQRDC